MLSGEVRSGDDVKGGGGKKPDIGEEIDEDSPRELGVGHVHGFPDDTPQMAGLCSIQGKCILCGMWSPVDGDEIGGSGSKPGRRWRGLLL